MCERESERAAAGSSDMCVGKELSSLFLLLACLRLGLFCFNSGIAENIMLVLAQVVLFNWF